MSAAEFVVKASVWTGFFGAVALLVAWWVTRGED